MSSGEESVRKLKEALQARTAEVEKAQKGHDRMLSSSQRWQQEADGMKEGLNVLGDALWEAEKQTRKALNQLGAARSILLEEEHFLREAQEREERARESLREAEGAQRQYEAQEEEAREALNRHKAASERMEATLSTKVKELNYAKVRLAECQHLCIKANREMKLAESVPNTGGPRMEVTARSAYMQSEMMKVSVPAEATIMDLKSALVQKAGRGSVSRVMVVTKQGGTFTPFSDKDFLGSKKEFLVIGLGLAGEKAPTAKVTKEATDAMREKEGGEDEVEGGDGNAV
eukprot:CAMPEP_0180614648 /NCGR_PEP_ID=MMETSP1037_2-20121125/31525_1 /TAXON_ID=632150 /ORGANISM="Azadinium spinosum, Strain 3D9" /LENGTH=287 /DNA_ID=CAMNT_0022634367 /DNA_START=76 /DNA_END=935 /DNA_ORIENTATION=+